MPKTMRRYILWTYLGFVLFIGLIGFVMVVLKLQGWATVLQTISAWTPTIVLLILFQSIYPNDSRQGFIRRQFNVPIKRSVLIQAIGSLLFVFGLTLFALRVGLNQPISQILILSPATLLSRIPLQLFSGPLGEELGWRAYMQTSMETKHTLIKSSLMVGLIWGFWHFPLWLISGYAGLELALYIISFLVAIVCCSPSSAYSIL